jgi:hypothetical protein
MNDKLKPIYKYNSDIVFIYWKNHCWLLLMNYFLLNVLFIHILTT